MVFIDQLIQLLDVVIWPVTLLVIFSWFKKELQGFFKNLKKIEAGADGFVFESFEAQMSKTRELFPDTTVSKSSKGIDDTPVLFSRDNVLTHQAQLSVWHDILADRIISKSQGATSDPQIALQQMKTSGIIRIDEYERQSNLLKLTSMTSAPLSEQSIAEIQGYLNNVSL